MTFFTLYYTTNHIPFITILKDYAAISDYVVHRGNNSIIVAVAYFSHYGCRDLAYRVCERECVGRQDIEVVNTVNYEAFHRIRDYVMYFTIVLIQ